MRNERLQELRVLAVLLPCSRNIAQRRWETTKTGWNCGPFSVNSPYPVRVLYEVKGCRRDQKILQTRKSTQKANNKGIKGVPAHPPQTQQCCVLRHHIAQEKAKQAKEEKAKQAKVYDTEY
jgi:hypothetical protein